MKRQLLILSLLASLMIPYTAATEETAVVETFTIEKRGLAGWETEEISCKYAIIDAKNKAKSSCNEKSGDVTALLNTSCHACKESEHFNEWYCTGKATVQCKYQSEKPVDNPLNKALRLLLDADNNPYTETNNPCTKDRQTKACSDYRSAKKLVGDKRG